VENGGRFPHTHTDYDDDLMYKELTKRGPFYRAEHEDISKVR